MASSTYYIKICNILENIVFCISDAPIIMTQQIHSFLYRAALGTNGKLHCLAKAAPKPTFLWHDPYEKVVQNSSKYSILAPKVSNTYIYPYHEVNCRFYIKRAEGDAYKCNCNLRPMYVCVVM